MDPDPAELAATVPAGHRVVADARAALSALVARAPSRGPARDWTEAHRAFLDSSTVPASRSEGGIDPSQVIAALREVVPEDSIMTNDAGNFRPFCTVGATTTPARSWHRLTGRWATECRPRSRRSWPPPSVLSSRCGDGGFFMTGQELETAVRYGTSILVVVFRNGMHGTIAMHQAREVGRTAGVEIGEVDLAGYARAWAPPATRARPRRPRAYTRRGTRLRRRHPRGRGDRPGRYQPFSPSLRTGSGQEPLHTWLRAS